MNAVDVMALSGNWDLACVQEDVKVLARKSFGFGDTVVEANRHLLGSFPVDTVADLQWKQWTPQKNVGLAFGTPPCSGWSGLNTRKTGPSQRGIDSGIHAYTWAVIKYAATCKGMDRKTGPEFVCFESVPQAFSQGKELMEKYHEYLCDVTGKKYKLTHVLMSGASVGAAAERKRYFWVASRVPFGVEVRSPSTPVTLIERIGHWTNQPLTWDTAHIAGKDDVVIDVMQRAGWVIGDRLRDACFRLLNKNRLPKAARAKWFDEYDCWCNFAGPKIVDPDKSMNVITGGAMRDFLHWSEHRFLTVREMCAIMGLPDEWVVPDRSVSKAVTWIGKNAPVESLRWITHWIKESFNDNPGELNGYDTNGVVNVTYAWRGPQWIK